MHLFYTGTQATDVWLHTYIMNRATKTKEPQCLWGVYVVVYLVAITDGQNWLAKM